MDVQTAIELVESILGQVRTVSPLLDQSTRARADKSISRETVSDVGFFGLFTDATVTAVDVTDYEGAEIVHDMCTKLPSHMIENYDFIFNGSCLDNIFDVAAAMRNFGLCLKPAGRIFQVEAASSSTAAYHVFSPEWFLDFFIANDWEDGSVYICRVGHEIGGFGFLKNPWDIYHWQPFSLDSDETLSGNGARSYTYRKKSRSLIVGMEFTVSVAQRGKGTVHVNPIQAVYRSDKMIQSESTAVGRWLMSDRNRYVGQDTGPHYPYSAPPAYKQAEQSYEYCGTIRYPDDEMD